MLPIVPSNNPFQNGNGAAIIRKMVYRQAATGSFHATKPTVIQEMAHLQSPNKQRQQRIAETRASKLFNK